jgi:hypothetical protein
MPISADTTTRRWIAAGLGDRARTSRSVLTVGSKAPRNRLSTLTGKKKGRVVGSSPLSLVKSIPSTCGRLMFQGPRKVLMLP